VSFPLRVSGDGTGLEGLAGPLLAANATVEGRTATLVQQGLADDGDSLPRVAVLEEAVVSGDRPLPPRASLYFAGVEALSPAWVDGRSRAVRRAIRALRRRAEPVPVAAPAEPSGTFDRWGANVVVVSLPERAEDAPLAALCALLHAAARPLLVDVRDPSADPGAIMAVLDLGAAGL
jgi:hypothetical protein